MFQEKARSAKILALQRRFSSCSNLGKQSDNNESIHSSTRQDSQVNSQDRKQVVNERILSSSMSSSSTKAPHFISQLYHPVEKNAQSSFESKLIHSSSVETPPPTAKFQTTRLRSGSCPQVWQPLKFSFPISIQTNNMNNSNSSLQNAGNEHKNIGFNKNVKADSCGYNQHIQGAGNVINSINLNAQKFNKCNIDNNDNVKLVKPLNNNNFFDNKNYQNNSNISYDSSNSFRISSAHNSPIVKKNMTNYGYNQALRQQCHENTFNKAENSLASYQVNKPQYNVHHNYGNSNISTGTNNISSFYNKTNNLNKISNMNPIMSSNDKVLEMNISLNSKQNNNNINLKSNVSNNHYTEDVHSSYEDLQEDDEFSTNEENYSSDLSPNPCRKSMYVNSHFNNLPNLKRTVSTDCFNNSNTSNDILNKSNVVSSEHVISSPALKHGNMPLSGIVELQNSVRNSFFSNTDVYNLRSPSDVVKQPFNKSLSTSSSSYHPPYSQSNVNQFKPTCQSTNQINKNKNMNLTKTTSEQFLSWSQKNDKLLKENGFNHLPCLNGNLVNQKPSQMLNENASSKFVSSIFLNLSSTSLANKSPKQGASAFHNSHQKQQQQQHSQLLHKQSSTVPSSSPLKSSPSSPKEPNIKQNIFMQRPSTLSLNKSNSAILNRMNSNMNPRDLNTNNMNANNLPKETNMEHRNNLNKRSNSAHNINNFQLSKTPMSPVCKKRQPTLSELQVFQAQKESFEKLLHHIKDMTRMRDKLKEDVKQLETTLVRHKLEASTNRIKPTNLQDLKKNNFILRSEILRLSQQLQNHNASNLDNHKVAGVNHQFNIGNNITVLSPSLIIKKDKELFFQFPNNENCDKIIKFNKSNSSVINIFNNINDIDDEDNVDDVGDDEDGDYDNTVNMYTKMNDKQRWSYNPSYNGKNC